MFDLTSQTLDEAVLAVQSTPETHQWIAAFALGEVVGVHHKTDLTHATRYIEALPEGLRTVFVNGLGHTAPWNVQAVQDQIAAIEMAIPETHRGGAYLGLVIHYTVAYGDDPDRVVAFAQQMGASLGIDPVDGVRIGMQKTAGHKLETALTRLSGFPPEFQSQMAEELGWRAGSDLRLEPKAILPLVAYLPDAARVRFVHGVCRGGWNTGLPLEALRPLMRELSESDRPHCMQAVAFAVVQSGWTATRIQEESIGLHEAEWVQMFVDAAASFSDRNQQGWHDPDLKGSKVP